MAQGARKFQFLQEIASGGFGSVYITKMIAADGSGTAQIVAVKLLHRRWTDNPEIASRMRDEARLLSRLRHDNIVEVLDFAVISGRSAVVMEYLDAVDAATLVDHLRTTNQILPLGAVLGIGVAVASALDAAYNRPPAGAQRPLRVIHRDIKPSNLMVDAQGRVKVLDFGVARAEFDAREAKTAELAFGSLEYMPPERLFFEPESAASDVYGLGTVLFELMMAEKLGKAKLRQTEQDRFLSERWADATARNADALRDPAVWTELGDLFHHMLAFDEGHRPSAAEVASRLQVVIGWLGAPTLADWAPATVPGILEVHRAGRQGGTLYGQVLMEDPPDPSQPSVLAADAEPSIAAVVRGVSQAGADDHTHRDDTRWNELRGHALPTGTDPADGYLPKYPPAPPGDPTVTPNRPLHPLEWAGEEDEFEGAPTVRMEVDDRLRPSSEPTFGRTTGSHPAATDRRRTEGSALDDLRYAEASMVDSSEHALGFSTPSRGNDRSAGSQGVSSGRPAEFEASNAFRAPENVLFSEVETVVVSADAAYASLSSGSYAGGVEFARSAGSPSSHPAEYPLVVAEPASGGGATVAYVLTAMLLLGTSLLILLSVFVVGGVVLAALTVPQAPSPQPVPAPVPLAPEPAPEPGPTPAPPSEGATPFTSFLSALPGTHRMMVRCDGATQVGEDRVSLPPQGTAEAPEGYTECTVTAVDGARKRRTAVVSDVKPRPYTCFTSEDASCE